MFSRCCYGAFALSGDAFFFYAGITIMQAFYQRQLLGQGTGSHPLKLTGGERARRNGPLVFQPFKIIPPGHRLFPS
jgi:hypothetical protein